MSGEMDGSALKSYVQALLTALGSNANHEIVVMVPQGSLKTFQRRLLQAAIQEAREANLKWSSIRSRIHVLDREENQSKQRDLLLEGRRVVWISGSDDIPTPIQSAKSFQHFLTDRLLSGETLSKEEQTRHSGAFITGAFEALLIPADQLDYVAQNSEKNWVFKNNSALNFLSKSLGAILQKIQLIRQSA